MHFGQYESKKKSFLLSVFWKYALICIMIITNCGFTPQWSFEKKYFWDLLTFTIAVINPPERKLAKRTSVHYFIHWISKRFLIIKGSFAICNAHWNFYTYCQNQFFLVALPQKFSEIWIKLYRLRLSHNKHCYVLCASSN